MTVGLSAHVTDALPHMRSALPGSPEAIGEDRLTRAQPPGLSASLPEGLLLYLGSWLSLRKVSKKCQGFTIPEGST